MSLTQKREPVEYTVLERSLVGNKIYEVGETAMYDGLPSENLGPTCDEGRARAIEYVESNKARLAKMKEQYGDSATRGDPAAFSKLFLEELAKANAQHAEQMAALQAGLADAVGQAVAAALAAAAPAKGKAAKAAAESDAIA
jgi:hypothetical protein